MSKKLKIVIGVLIAVLVVLLVFWGGYLFGLSQCKPCAQSVVKEEVKKPTVKKKLPKKVEQQVVKQPEKQLPASAPAPAPALVLTPAPVPAPTLIPILAPAPQKLILRLNIVEWSEVFAGGSLMSRDIGPLIRKGLSDGTVVRTATPHTFSVNGATVLVRDGQTVLDPGQIGPETAIVVQPLGDVRFASPPGELPLVTGPGELDSLAKKGVKEIWLNFLLAPR